MPKPFPRDDIVAAYMSGLSMQHVQKTYHVGPKRVRRLLRKCGVPLRNRREATQLHWKNFQSIARPAKRRPVFGRMPKVRASTLALENAGQLVLPF